MAWSLLAYFSRDTCLQSSDWGRNSNTSFSGVPFLLLPELPPLMSWIRQKMLWVFQFNIFGTLTLTRNYYFVVYGHPSKSPSTCRKLSRKTPFLGFSNKYFCRIQICLIHIFPHPMSCIRVFRVRARSKGQSSSYLRKFLKNVHLKNEVNISYC